MLLITPISKQRAPGIGVQGLEHTESAPALQWKGGKDAPRTTDTRDATGMCPPSACPGLKAILPPPPLSLPAEKGRDGSPSCEDTPSPKAGGRTTSPNAEESGSHVLPTAFAVNGFRATALEAVGAGIRKAVFPAASH